MPALAHHADSRRALSTGAIAWIATAILGQWAFVVFIASFFGRPLLNGDLAPLNTKPHITGYVPGDILGNLQFVGHALLGGWVTFAGIWQLLPSMRRRWPKLHRWNGRAFIGVATLITLSGFYLTWVRGSQLGPGSNLSITLNGLLILCFGALAWRSARRREMASHRRHAIRTYLLVNGVWFLRIGIMLAGLVLVPVGIKLDYQGPAFVIVSFGSWVLPLLVAQLYFRAERSNRSAIHYGVGGLLGILALVTLAGSAAAVAFMWWPFL